MLQNDHPNKYIHQTFCYNLLVCIQIISLTIKAIEIGWLFIKLSIDRVVCIIVSRYKKIIIINKNQFKTTMSSNYNVILMGSMGVGKSTVINKLVGSEVAASASGGSSCTQEPTLYAS